MLRIILLVCVYVFVSHSIHAQQVATIHVRAPFDRKNGIYISKYCDKTSVSEALFLGRSGDAYLYWVITLPSGVYGWDSVSLSSHTILVNTMKRTITAPIIDSLKPLATDSACNYLIAIREGGIQKDGVGIGVSYIDRNKYLADKVKPLVNCLENMAATYIR